MALDSNESSGGVSIKSLKVKVDELRAELETIKRRLKTIEGRRVRRGGQGGQHPPGLPIGLGGVRGVVCRPRA